MPRKKRIGPRLGLGAATGSQERIDGDDLAPPGAVDLLARKLPRARLLREHVKPSWKVEKKNDPHFRWARDPGTLPARVAEYVREL